jgi:hypothetical protein
MTAVTHIAGYQVQVGPLVRQRCAWCGALLEDHDLTRVAVPEGQDPRPGEWEPSRLVEVDGNMSRVVEHLDGGYVPENCCAALDPQATRLDGFTFTRASRPPRVSGICSGLGSRATSACSSPAAGASFTP